MKEIVLSDGQTIVRYINGEIYIDTQGAFEACGFPVARWWELRSVIDSLVTENKKEDMQCLGGTGSPSSLV